MQVGGSAAGMPNTERRRGDQCAPQRSEQDRVEREAHRMDSRDGRHADKEAEVAHPTPRRRWVAPQQPKHCPVVGPVEVEARSHHEFSSALAHFGGRLRQPILIYLTMSSIYG